MRSIFRVVQTAVILAGLSVAGYSQQTTPPDSTTSTTDPYNRMGTRPISWGWLGLIGLFGLAGLRRRPDRTDYTDTTGSPRLQR